MPDPRYDHTKRHLLLDILFIAICTVICGGENFEDMAEFGNAKEQWLRKFLKLPFGIPSHDTFRDVISRMNPVAFSECFMRWTAAIHESTGGEVIALDGKTVRHSFDRFSGKAAVHLVSAWATEAGIALGQMKVDSDSNEITAIPKLLDILDIRGCIVTMDAMGCQKEIAKQIIDSGADYLLSLKGNQTKLHEDVKYFFDEAFDADFEEIEHRYFKSLDKDHGRIETRECWVVEDVAIRWLGDTGYDWPGIRSIGAIRAQRKIGESVSCETRYFISSLAGNAETFARAARSHWAIENSLHWVLDVTFNEDQNRARYDNAAENLATLRKMALNLAKLETSFKSSVRRKLLRAGWDNSYLEKLLVG